MPSRLANLNSREVQAPSVAMDDAMGLLRDRFPDGKIRVERAAWGNEKTLAIGANGRWSRGCSEPASSFELLRQAGAVGRPTSALTRSWEYIRATLGNMTTVR